MIEEIYKQYEEAKKKIFEAFSLDRSLCYDIQLENNQWTIEGDNLSFLSFSLRDERLVGYKLYGISIYKSKDDKYTLISGEDGCGGTECVILINSLEITNEEEKELFEENYM